MSPHPRAVVMTSWGVLFIFESGTPISGASYRTEYTIIPNKIYIMADVHRAVLGDIKNLKMLLSL